MKKLLLTVFFIAVGVFVYLGKEWGVNDALSEKGADSFLKEMQGVQEVSKGVSMPAQPTVVELRASEHNPVQDEAQVPNEHQPILEDVVTEAARNLFYMNSKERIEAIELISKHPNEIAVSVLADQAVTGDFSDEEKTLMLKVLLDNRPGFSKHIAELGMMRVVEFNQWVRAVANLNGALNEERLGDFLLGMYPDGFEDVRIAVALFNSDYYPMLQASHAGRQLSQVIQEYVDGYNHDFPNNVYNQQSDRMAD